MHYIKAEYKTFAAGNCWVAYEFHNTADGQAYADPGRTYAENGVANPFCDRSGDRLAGQPEHYGVLKAKHDITFNDAIYSYVQLEYSYTSDMMMDGSSDPLHFAESRQVMNLRFFMNFEELDMDVIVWGRNVLNTEYVANVTFNTPIQDGKVSGYLSEPATFGVTVKKRF